VNLQKEKHVIKQRLTTDMKPVTSEVNSQSKNAKRPVEAKHYQSVEQTQRLRVERHACPKTPRGLQDGFRRRIQYWLNRVNRP